MRQRPVAPLARIATRKRFLDDNVPGGCDPGRHKKVIPHSTWQHTSLLDRYYTVYSIRVVVVQFIVVRTTQAPVLEEEQSTRIVLE